MRPMLIIGLTCALAAPLAMARAIPDPHQKHAPGNEAVQTPIAQAGYSTAVNYQLQCAGCHLGDGSGSKANDVPRMKDFVGNFLKVDG
ncbi:MAG: cytochrome C, partial [Pseudomonas sp.]